MLKYRNLVFLLLFVVGFGKTLIVPASLVDAALLLIAGGIFAYSDHRNQQSQVAKLEAVVEQHHKELEELKEKVTSIKIVQQVKPNNLAFRS